MNNKQRKQWDDLAGHAAKLLLYLTDDEQATIVTANAYLMKLERELQNIKGHKRIAAVLKPKMEV
jgi:hypothetical protein